MRIVRQTLAERKYYQYYTKAYGPMLKYSSNGLLRMGKSL